MDKANCSKCSKEFEKEAEDKVMICQMCDNDLKSDILIFQVFKWTCFSIALATVTFFIPLLAAKETSSGYYSMPGKSRPMSISQKGRAGWIVAIPFVATSFGFIGLYLGKKEDEKKSLYRNYRGNDLLVK